jgi:hypothetical protein
MTTPLEPYFVVFGFLYVGIIVLGVGGVLLIAAVTLIQHASNFFKSK